ncbi:hypothetical protein F4779DRAFT_33619 [Xylariaceae sp. FL0662B]|nr:hypothetical protein F4779DRAFT_33619 [Xylariaceae sp. FL0662B]
MVHLLTLLALVLPAFIIANPVQPHGNAYYNVGNERRLIQRFANTTISSGSSTIPSTNQSSVATSSSRQTLSTVSLTSTPATNSSGSTIISITSGTSSTVLKTSSALSASSVSSSSTLSSTSSQISTASNSSTASASSSPPSSSSYISSSTASSYSSFTKSASASSTTSSPSSQSAQNSTISLTSFPTYIAPSSTTLTGAQESSESKKIAPLFLWLYSQKDSLQDSNRKQEYVDNVKKTNDEVVALLDSLDTHPDPEPECDKTALKRWALSETKLKKLIAEKRVVVRSLVSGIIDELDNAAKLLSCATKIMGNLVNAVESTDVSTDVVQNLTDSLKDIEEALEKQDDKPSSSVTESTSDTTSSASCTQSSAVASCTETISLSTIFSAAGTTTTSSIKTITTTTCDTITACSATATTVTTTISTSSTTSSSAWVCEATSCSTCTQSTSRRAEPPSNGGLYELDRRAPFLMGDLEEWKGDEDDYFTQRVRNGENVQELDWNVFDRADPLSVEAISLNREFGTADQVTWVDGITGCTVLVVVSKRGLWFAHLFEGGFVERNSVETDKWNHILQYVQNGGSRFILPSTLASNGGILSKDNDVQIYIHTPAVGTRKVNPQNKAARYADKVNQISNYLFGAGTPFEGIEVKISTYYKPEDHDPNLPDTETGAGEISRYANTARFKVMIEYSPALKYFREDDCTEPTAKARRVWFEKDPIYPVFWDIIPESTNKVKRQACSIRTTASGSATASSTSGASNSGTSTLTGSSSKLSSTTKHNLLEPNCYQNQ